MIIEIELDSDALNYFKRKIYLDQWDPHLPKPLRSHLLNLKLDNGRIISYWNKDADRKSANILERSLSFYGFPLLSLSQPYLTQKIVQYLKNEKEGVAIFELLPVLSEKHIAILECSYVHHDKRPYYLITGKFDKELERAVNYAVEDARYYPFVCCLTTYPLKEFDDIKPKSEISTKTLRKLASRAKKIITDAYDAESFIVWERMDKSSID